MSFGTKGCMYCEGECNKECLSQEEPKQETLEEAAWRYNPVKKLDGEFIRQAFKEGAKWQAERMYSEEDLKEAFRQGQDNIDYSDTYGWSSKLTEQEWFEQFKKK